MRKTAIAALLLSYLTLGDARRVGKFDRFALASGTTGHATPGSVPDSNVPAATQVIQVLEGSLVEKLDLRQVPAAPPAVPLLPAAAPVPTVPNVKVDTSVLPAVPAVPVPGVPAVPAIPTVAPAAAPVAPVAPPTNLPTTSLATVPAIPPANLPAVPPVVAPAAPPAIPPAPPVAVPLTPPANPLAAAPTQTASEFVTVQWIETWIGGTSRTWLPHTITIHNEGLSNAPLPGKGEVGMGTLTGKPGVTRTFIKGAAQTLGPDWIGAVAAVGMGIAGIL